MAPAKPFRELRFLSPNEETVWTRTRLYAGAGLFRAANLLFRIAGWVFDLAMWVQGPQTMNRWIDSGDQSERS